MVFLGIVIVIVVGAIVKFAAPSLLPYRATAFGAKPAPSVSWPEFALGASILTPLLVFATVAAGNKVAVNNQVNGYREYYNGWELKTPKPKTITCTKDGSCVHEYQCDPWVEIIHHPAVTDSKGNVTSPAYDEQVTHYHDCPLTTTETTYTIETTLGDYTAGSHWLPANPEQHRWTGDREWTRHGTAGFPSGIPATWQAAHDRIAAHRNGPVTQVNPYTNYILSSQMSILRAYSSAVDRLLAARLLPRPAKGVSDLYQAAKVYPVGVQLPGGDRVWQDAHARLNGALGGERRGDLHTIVVDAAKVDDPDEYLAALQAYWQGPKLGKDGASKNTIMLVLGTADGKTVTWARAATGMPSGNEALLGDLQNDLKGQSLDPAVLYGDVRVTFRGGKASHTGGGVIEHALFGEHAFVREHMRGYKYLRSEIQPTGRQKAVILAVLTCLAAVMWVLFLVLDDRILGAPVDRIVRRFGA